MNASNPSPRNSLGVWAFGPNVTRFVPPGYHPEAAKESMVEKTKRVTDGLCDVLDGLEYHYPGEVDEDSAPAILDVGFSVALHDLNDADSLLLQAGTAKVVAEDGSTKWQSIFSRRAMGCGFFDPILADQEK